MRAISALVLIIGLALGGLAAYKFKSYIDQTEAQRQADMAALQQAEPTIDVIAVNAVVAYGEELTPDKLVVIKYAERFLPEGAFRTMEEVFPEGESKVRLVLRQMEINEPLLAVKVTAPGGDAGLTSLLQPGMRAFAIFVDVGSGVSGLLRPGDRVDVYWTGRGIASATDMGTTEMTKLIISNVKIIAIDQQTNTMQAGTTVARTVTVEATPEQVAALAQAQSTGSLMLSLVGLNDTAVTGPVQMDQKTLLGITDPEPEAGPEIAAEPAVVEEERVCTIRTRRGADVVEMPIPCSE